MPAYLEPVEIDEHGHVANDVPCAECAYDLRTLSLDAPCPECGRLVGETADRFYLFTTDRVWLKTVRRGIMAIGLVPILFILSMCVIMAVALRNRPFSPHYMSSMYLVPAALNLVYGAVWLLGVVWLSTPEPGRVEREGDWAARKVLRWAGVYGSLGFMAMGLLNTVVFGLTGAPFQLNALGVLLMIIGSIIMILALIAPLAMIRYLRFLALRVPARQLAGFGGILFWLAGVTVVGFIAFQVTSMVIFAGPMGLFGESAKAVKPPENLSVHLNAAQRESLARGNMLSVGPIDPDDPNSTYVVNVGRAMLGPNVPVEPNAAGVVGAFMVVADPTDPNRVVPYVAAGTMPIAPVGRRFEMISGLSRIFGCTALLFVAALFIFLILVDHSLSQVIKAMAAEPASLDLDQQVLNPPPH